MNNVSSYCGLVIAKIRASDKDLPVLNTFFRAYLVTFFFLFFREVDNDSYADKSEVVVWEKSIPILPQDGAPTSPMVSHLFSFMHTAQ